MAVQLNPKFVIEKESTDKQTYIDTINAFINSYENFHPESKNSWYKSEFDYALGRSYIAKYKLTLLDSTIFTNGKTLNNSNYYINLCYSDIFKKNVIVFTTRYGYGDRRQAYILGEDKAWSLGLTLNTLRTLYKKVVSDIGDYAKVMRELKLKRDFFTDNIGLRYHFNPTTNKGVVFLKSSYKTREMATVTFCPFAIKDGLVKMRTYSDTRSYLFSDFANEFQNSINTDDFEKDIKPSILLSIEKQKELLNDKNNGVMAKIQTVKSMN